MPAFLLDYYETVSNCSKNVEKHTPALFMMYHHKTMTIYLKFFNLFVCLLCSASGVRKIKLETAADNVYQIGCECYSNQSRYVPSL